MSDQGASAELRLSSGSIVRVVRGGNSGTWQLVLDEGVHGGRCQVAEVEQSEIGDLGLLLALMRHVHRG